MKSSLRIIFVLGLALSIGTPFWGCKKSEDSAGPPGGGGGGQFITIQTPFGPFTIPTLGISNFKGLLLATLQDTSKQAQAIFFGSSTSQLVYAGNVTVNTNAVDSLGFSGQVIYLRPKPTNPQALTGVNFDGSAHNWTVSGSGSIPAFNASVTSPSGAPAISSPTADATVPRSQPLTINWTGSGSDSVFINFIDSQGNVLAAVVSGNTYTFSSTQMGTLQPGTASIDVNRFKVTLVSAGGGTYFVAAATSSEVIITLN